MTAFTGSLTVAVNGVALTDWIDYSVSITQGYQELDGAFQPGVLSLKLFNNADTAFTPQLGDVITIGDATFGDLFTGRLVDKSIALEVVGNTSSLASCTMTVMGPTYDLLNSQWYLDADTTDDADNWIDIIMAQVGQTQWYEVNPTLTWDGVNPALTWPEYSDYNSTLINGFSRTGTIATSMQFTAGTRNAWDDLQTIMASIRGTIDERYDGLIMFNARPSSPTVSLTWDANWIDSAINTSASLNDIRNSISVTNLSGTSPIVYRDDTSVYLYGEKVGSIDTILTNTGDVDTLGTLLLDTRSYPDDTINSISADLCNPNMTDTDRTHFFDTGVYGPVYLITATGIPAALGSETQDLIGIGRQINLSKNTWIFTYNTVSYSAVYPTPTWSRIGFSYTWTSYGAAFPTQKWSDL